MEELKSFYQAISDICDRDPRYKPDSYEFVMQALNFTQKEFKKEGHISGQELLEGIRKFALDQYGPMAKTVLQHWGITRTSDFGNIVFNMIEQKVLSKTESDTQHDFDDVYDFETAFKHIIKDLQI
jgi:uncharacterized repeat protein (TIGR04138 family)